MHATKAKSYNIDKKLVYDASVNGGFYVQAFSGSVALPVVGYDYDSLSGILLSAGLAPAGMIASFAAPTRPRSSYP